MKNILLAVLMLCTLSAVAMPIPLCAPGLPTCPPSPTNPSPCPNPSFTLFMQYANFVLGQK